jgi:hypothetical protein
MNKYSFNFRIIKSMVRSDFNVENAEDIDGEVVAMIVCNNIEDEVSVLNADDSDRTGIWRLPEQWLSFYISSYVDPDYASALDSEFNEGKVLDSSRTFDVKLLMDIEGKISLEAENYHAASQKLPHLVIDHLFDCVENNCDSKTLELFDTGTILKFEYEILSEEKDGIIN